MNKRHFWYLIVGGLVIGLFVSDSLVGCNAEGAKNVELVSPVPPTPEPTSTSTPIPTEPSQAIEAPHMQVSVPMGSAAVLDGEISEGEWDQAAVYLFEDGSELLLMHADGFLYLAIRASQPGLIVGNIYLQRGEEVSVLHSSAALGTAKFAWQNDVWARTQNFSWCCRETGFSEAAQAAREEFLQQEDWLAANARMGTPNELEYQIGHPEEIDALAVNILEDLEPNPFPAGLSDDCVQAFPGGIPEEMRFAIENWTRLDLAQE